MRGIAAVLILSAASVSAQTDAETLSRIREVSQAVAQVRPDTTAGPTFRAAWSTDSVYVGVGHHVPDGTFWASDAPLAMVLGSAWDSRIPFGSSEPRTAMTPRLIDVPDSLRRRPLDATVYQPGLTYQTFGPHILDRLADELGLDIRFESRPQTVYVLRATASATGKLAAGEPSERMVAAHLAYTSRAQGIGFVRQTSADIAQGVSRSMQRVVVDETGLSGDYSFTLRLDPQVVDLDRTSRSAEEIDAVRAALAEATGLELVPQVRPVEWMVVRAASR